MTELVRSWVMGITAAALLTSVAMAITPKGRTRAVVSLVCGLVTIIALVSPVVGFDYDAFAGNMAQYNFTLEDMAENLDEENERLTSLIIREQCEAYILDKAELLDMTGLDIVVDTARNDDGDHYPYQVWITGTYTAEQKREMEDYLAGTFGIPVERQYWSTEDEEIGS